MFAPAWCVLARTGPPAGCAGAHVHLHFRSAELACGRDGRPARRNRSPIGPAPSPDHPARGPSRSSGRLSGVAERPPWGGLQHTDDNTEASDNTGHAGSAGARGAVCGAQCGAGRAAQEARTGTGQHGGGGKRNNAHKPARHASCRSCMPAKRACRRGGKTADAQNTAGGNAIPQGTRSERCRRRTRGCGTDDRSGNACPTGRTMRCRGGSRDRRHRDRRGGAG